MSSSHHQGNYRKSSSLRPIGRPHSAGGKAKHKSRGSPLQKLAAMFKRERNTENGRVSVRPACFMDDPYVRRSESPEGPSGRKRSNSVGNKNAFKIWKGGKEGRAQGKFPMWRPRVSFSFCYNTSIRLFWQFYCD